MTKPRISEKVKSFNYDDMMVQIEPPYNSGLFHAFMTETDRKRALEDWAEEVATALSNLRSFYGTSVTVVGVEEYDACSVCNGRWEPWDDDRGQEWNGTDKVKDGPYCASCGAIIE